MNKRDLSKVFMFVAGAAIGSLATWQITKRYYDQLLEQEFESMRDYFENKKLEESEQEIQELKEAVENLGYTAREAADKAKEKPGIMEFAAKIQESEYVDYANVKGTKEPPASREKSVPYVISPEMVEESEYNLMTLTYYQDGVLTDDWNDTENYADNLAGCNFKDHFGDYVEDVVHVRNDALGIDYEITLDPRKYSDTVNPDQHSMEDE